MSVRTRSFVSIALLLTSSAALGAANGGNYPGKPVRLLVGFTAGGSTDIVARLLAQRLSTRWNQQVVVDNRPGAGANIAAEMAAKSAPDGYTLILAQNSLAISPTLYPKLGYDAKKDLKPIVSVASSPHILVVHPSLPVKSVSQLVALAKARPGELNFASSGVGINDHMGGELFRELAKLNVVHVPYKGGAQAVTSILAGETSFYFAGVLTALPLMKQERLRPLAVTSLQRFKSAKDLPTMDESGLKGFELILWQGLFAPTGIPDPVVQKISADVVAMLRDAGTVARFEELGLTPFPGSPAQFKSFYDSEYEKWGRIVRSAGIRLK